MSTSTAQHPFVASLGKLSKPQFLRKYSKEEMIENAADLGLDLDEDLSKDEMYDEIAMAELEVQEDNKPTEISLSVKPTPTRKGTQRGHSTVIEPVRKVWLIADKMFSNARDNGEKPPRRVDVLNECERQGIAPYTAKTQYQLWFTHTNRGTRLMSMGNVPEKWNKDESEPADVTPDALEDEE